MTEELLDSGHSGCEGKGEDRDIVFLPKGAARVSDGFSCVRDDAGRAVETEEFAIRVASLDDAVGQMRELISRS